MVCQRHKKGYIGSRETPEEFAAVMHIRCKENLNYSKDCSSRKKKKKLNSVPKLELVV